MLDQIDIYFLEISFGRGRVGKGGVRIAAKHGSPSSQTTLHSTLSMGQLAETFRKLPYIKLKENKQTTKTNKLNATPKVARSQINQQQNGNKKQSLEWFGGAQS